MRRSKAAMNNFENNIQQYANDNDKLYRERDKIVRSYEMKRNELEDL